MTIQEFQKINLNYLSDKARHIVEVSDQTLCEYLKDVDANDISGLNAALESLSDEILQEEE